ncbi:helix-turn-helix domain-containing protein [Kitasatospora sp. NPDC059327]|uniref:helix-turn-helix domain-containing protein n=1 Tax=Kitasatospora sp. NPDC059327 TaxID=3346803 RepID=UPI00368B6B3B
MSDQPVQPDGSPAAAPALSEEHAAERVRLEREHLGWSTGELAKRMTAAGCPINQSSVWRIENGEPRRRINLDEAIGFAKVFGLTLEEFLGPPGSSADKHITQLTTEVVARYRFLLDLMQSTSSAFKAVDQYSALFPQHAKELNNRIARALTEENRRRGPVRESPMVFLRYPTFHQAEPQADQPSDPTPKE